MSFNSPPARYEIVNAPLRLIIRIAFQIQDSQIVDAPAWIATDRFDITAATNGTTVTETERREMLRGVLADRFNLRAQMEVRELPVFELLLAREDRRLGAGARSTDVNCAALAAARSSGTAPGTPPGSIGTATERPPCGLMTRPGMLTGGAMTMGEFAQMLAPLVNRFVIDRTGLIGAFDLDVKYMPDQVASPPPGAPALPSGDNGPSLFTALQEQLGLRLNATRGPVPVLVVANIDRPSPD